MKYVIFILSLFNMNAFGSCLVSIENGGKNYMVSIWKHTEGHNDTVEHKYYTANEIQAVLGILVKHSKLRVIFNQGVFTSMDYWDGKVKKWANLTRGEKDAIYSLQEKFDVTEK